MTLTKGFYLGATEVTNEQYRKWKPGHTSGVYQGRDLNGPQQPVVNASRDDAQGLADWAENRDPGREARLPTEAEWEHACRAGTTASRYWGAGEAAGGEYANVYDRTAKAAAFPRITSAPMETDDGFAITAAVGTFKPNGFGLFDMIGNVWEWCEDWFAEYGGGPETDPTGPSTRPSRGARILRGGSWCNDASFCRAACRNWDVQGDISIGVRLAFSRGPARARSH